MQRQSNTRSHRDMTGSDWIHKGTPSTCREAQEVRFAGTGHQSRARIRRPRCLRKRHGHKTRRLDNRFPCCTHDHAFPSTLVRNRLLAWDKGDSSEACCTRLVHSVHRRALRMAGPAFLGILDKSCLPAPYTPRLLRMSRNVRRHTDSSDNVSSDR